MNEIIIRVYQLRIEPTTMAKSDMDTLVCSRYLYFLSGFINEKDRPSSPPQDIQLKNLIDSDPICVGFWPLHERVMRSLGTRTIRPERYIEVLELVIGFLHRAGKFKGPFKHYSWIQVYRDRFETRDQRISFGGIIKDLLLFISENDTRAKDLNNEYLCISYLLGLHGISYTLFSNLMIHVLTSKLQDMFFEHLMTFEDIKGIMIPLPEKRKPLMKRHVIINFVNFLRADFESGGLNSCSYCIIRREACLEHMRSIYEDFIVHFMRAHLKEEEARIKREEEMKLNTMIGAIELD